VTSQKFRDQGRNFDDCMEKLRLMIVAVVAAPTPRRETKPSRAMKERRVEAKRETSVKNSSANAQAWMTSLDFHVTLSTNIGFLTATLIRRLV